MLLFENFERRQFLTWGGGHNGVRQICSHLLFSYYACDVYENWHGCVQAPSFLIFNKRNFRKRPFLSFFVAFRVALFWRCCRYYSEYIGKIPISVDENCKKIWSRNFFSFIFSGKLLDKIILKVKKDQTQKNKIFMWKLKSTNGGANLPHPTRDRVNVVYREEGPHLVA